MEHGNPTIIFPAPVVYFDDQVTFFKEISIHVRSHSQKDLWTCVYVGKCVCRNFETLELENYSKLKSDIYPMIIVPEGVNMEPNWEQGYTDANGYIDASVLVEGADGNYISLYSGNCYAKYTDDFKSSVLEESSSNSIELDYVNSEDLLGLDSSLLNNIKLSLDLENDLNSLIDQDAFDLDISNLFDENGTVFTNDEWSPSSTLYDIDTDSTVSSVLNEDHYVIEHVDKEVTETDSASQTIADTITYEEDDILYEVEFAEMTVEQSDRNKSETCLQQEGDDEALKQLMSSNIQSLSKQRKIILFSGKDSRHGQTIQKMSYSDSNYDCPADVETDTESIIDPKEEAAIRKKYQCTKCHRMFNQLSEFKKHIADHGRPRYTTRNVGSRTSIEYIMCQQCGKKLKTQEKYEIHCLGHGDPDRECQVCHSVLASKFSLRTHMKTHNRKHRCNYCTKTFDKKKTLKTHTSKMHPHELSEMVLPEAFTDEVLTENEILKYIEVDELKLKESKNYGRKSEVAKTKNKSRKVFEKKIQYKGEDETNAADENDIMTKAVSHVMFMSKDKKHLKGRKQCNVCPKSFDRISDLKRHLIEHTLSSTLRKNPANKNGTLDIQCCLCDRHFNKIDKYKAHLREHANLTMYTCTFCDKSFSDSSNFSKHKKVHGLSSSQCDMCQRKFNSKKMLVQHMEYHEQNPPVQCFDCDKVFHFDSMLKKHIKSCHSTEMLHRFRCRFCHMYFKTLKEKWDHEWLVHNVRKMIVDCNDCGAKFRKYSELKRHCLDEHDLVIPLAKNMIKETRSSKRKGRLAYE